MSDSANSLPVDSSSPLSRWIFDWGKIVFGFLVVVSAPLLYVHGTIYYHSYLEVFGLEPALFAIDKESTFVKGYFVALQMGASLLSYLLIFVVLTCGAAFLVDELISRGKWNVKPIFSSLTAKGIAASCAASATAAAGIILLALSMLAAHRLGTAQATMDAEQFRTKSKAAGTSRVIALIDQEGGRVTLDGFKILCSDKWCAFYVGSKIDVYPLDKIRFLQSGAPERKP